MTKSKFTESETQARAVIATLRRSRVKAGISQKELAEKLGVTPHTLCRWEGRRGKHVYLDTMLEIAAAIGCDVSIEIKPNEHNLTPPPVAS